MRKSRQPITTQSNFYNNKHNILFYKIWKNENKIQLKKMGLNNWKRKNHPPSSTLIIIWYFLYNIITINIDVLFIILRIAVIRKRSLNYFIWQRRRDNQRASLTPICHSPLSSPPPIPLLLSLPSNSRQVLTQPWYQQKLFHF